MFHSHTRRNVWLVPRQLTWSQKISPPPLRGGDRVRRICPDPLAARLDDGAEGGGAAAAETAIVVGAFPSDMVWRLCDFFVSEVGVEPVDADLDSRSSSLGGENG